VKVDARISSAKALIIKVNNNVLVGGKKKGTEVTKRPNRKRKELQLYRDSVKVAILFALLLNSINCYKKLKVTSKV
jgi:hypothetical protein